MIDKQSDILGMFREIAKNLLRDGHTLWRPSLNENSVFDWEVYGDWECPPWYWMRYGPAYSEPNRVRGYIISYVPRPSIGGGANMQGVHKHYNEGEIYHFTVGSWNDGYGWSYLLRAWDSITKLRYASNADQFLRDVRFLILVPESWKKDRIDRFTDTVDNWTHSRALIMKAQQNQTLTPTGLPAVGAQNMMMPGQGSSGQGGMFQKSTTGETLQDPEYGRLFIATGFNKTWFVGTEAGTELGGAANFTDDILAEIQIFRLIEPIFKNILEIILQPLVDMGQIDPLPPQYALKFWKEDEILQNQTMAIQQQMQMMDYQSNLKGKEDQSRQNTLTKQYNDWVNARLEIAVRLNSNMPMTPVMSSWVESVGAYKGQLLVKYHGEDDIFGYNYGGWNPEGIEGDTAHEKYEEMAMSGSKGGWLWDNVLLRPSVYGMAQGELFQQGSKIKHQTPPGRPVHFKYNPVGSFGEGIATGQTTEEMRLAKTKGHTTAQPGLPALGTSREPWSLSEWQGNVTSRGRSSVGTDLTSRIPPEVFKAPIPKVHNEAPYKLSYKRFNELSKDIIDHSWGKDTNPKIRKLWEYWDTEGKYKNVLRVNSMAKGTGLTFTSLWYEEDGTYIEEFPCMSDYRKNNMGREVPLEVYHRGGEFIVGTYKVVDWNEERDEPIAEIFYDDVLVEAAIHRLNAHDSRLAQKFYKGLVPDISEEYECSVIKNWHSKRLNREIRLQRDITLTKVALVDYGNCPDYKCVVSKVNEGASCQVERKNAEFDTSKPGKWITIKGVHIYVLEGETVEEALNRKKKKEKEESKKKESMSDSMLMPMRHLQLREKMMSTIEFLCKISAVKASGL